MNPRALLLQVCLVAGLGCGDASTVDPGGAGTASTSGSASTGGGVVTSTAATSSGGTSGSVTSTDGPEADTTGNAVATGSTGTPDSAGQPGTSTGEPDGTTDGATTTAASDEGGSSSTGAEPVIPGPQLKVMTFNIRVGTAADGENAWDLRKPLVYQVLKDQNADFVGMQEALRFQLLEIDEAVTKYDRIGVGTVDGATKGPYNAIYYKRARFTVEKSGTFWLSDTPGEPGSQTWGNKFPRAVTWGRFADKTTGYTFYVYNTHFDHVSQHSRERSAVLLADRIAARAHPEDPFVVTGDFNAAEGNLVVRFLKGNAAIDGQQTAAKLRDTFRVVHPDATAVGTAHGFNGGTGGNKIDYVFVPPKQEVVDAHIDHFNVDGRYPSDHFPVVGTVIFADK